MPETGTQLSAMPGVPVQARGKEKLRPAAHPAEPAKFPGCCNKAFRGIVNCHKIVHRVRADASKGSTPHNQHHAPNQQQIQTVEPCFCHLKPHSLFSPERNFRVLPSIRVNERSFSADGHPTTGRLPWKPLVCNICGSAARFPDARTKASGRTKIPDQPRGRCPKSPKIQCGGLRKAAKERHFDQGAQERKSNQ